MLKIISLGNELRGDDGIGPRVLEQLTKMKHPIPIKFINAGSDAFIILEHLVDSDPLILIDCALMDKDPGSVYKFEVDGKNLNKSKALLGLHGFSFSELMHLAQKVGDPASCTIIGVEPKSTEFDTELSPEVEQAIPGAMQLVLEEIESYANSENFSH